MRRSSPPASGASHSRRRAAHAFTVTVSGTPIPVDVISYGGVEDDDGTVLMPDDQRISVLGLKDVFAGAAVRTKVLAVIDDADLRARLAGDMRRAIARDPARLLAFRDGVLEGVSDG